MLLLLLFVRAACIDAGGGGIPLNVLRALLVHDHLGGDCRDGVRIDREDRRALGTSAILVVHPVDRVLEQRKPIALLVSRGFGNTFLFSCQLEN